MGQPRSPAMSPFDTAHTTSYSTFNRNYASIFNLVPFLIASYLSKVAHFWPTVLSVEPLARCVVCRLSVVCLSVCNVLYCGKTVHLSEKVSEGVNRKPGSKSSFFGSSPYFYFRFRRYGQRDGLFCLIFCPYSPAIGSRWSKWTF